MSTRRQGGPTRPASARTPAQLAPALALALMLGAFAGKPAVAQEVPADTGIAPPRTPVRLSLQDVTRAAATTTPTAAIAALRAEEARGRLTQARSVFFPSFSGAASFVRRTQNLKSFGFNLPTTPGAPPIPTRIGPINIWDFRGQVTQGLLEPSGWLRASAARAQVAAASAEATTSGETAAAQAAGAYVTALHAQAAVGAREEDVRLAQELVHDAEAQFKAGVGTRLDVVRANTQEAQARGAVELARAQLTQAEIDLARTLGLRPGTRFALIDSLAPALGRSEASDSAGRALVTPAPAAGAASAGEAAAVALALARRPEIVAARAGVLAAGLASRAVKAQRLGRLELAADYGPNGPRREDMINTGQLALQYAIPFFDGFRIEGQVQEQEAQRREAEVRLADLREQVIGDVRGALAAVASGLAQQAIAAEQLTLAREELREARLRFTNGVSGNIDVITAQADVVRARTAVLDALAQTAGARVRLARAAGVTASLR